MASSKERHINENLPVRASFCTEAAVWRLEVGHTLLSDSRWHQWLDESAFYMFDLVSSLNGGFCDSRPLSHFQLLIATFD